jgi:hypothetical protein
MLLHGRAKGGDTGGDGVVHVEMLAEARQGPYPPQQVNQFDEMFDAISQRGTSAAKMPNFQHGCFP